MGRSSLRPVSGIILGALSAALLASTSAWAAPDPSADVTDSDNPFASQDQSPPPVTQQPGTQQRRFGYAPQAQLGPAEPSFVLSGLAGLSETFVTNVAGQASGGQDDFDSRLQLQLNALERTADFTGALNYAGTLDEFARSSSGRPVINTNLAGIVDYRPFPDYLRIDARFFATPIVDNPTGPVSAPGV